ncbi:ankyrin repeat domain-containing protein [Endozoicomonas sp. 8E]|uniref:ankyrin repeat domain-containing protein n=1 Tax=Endozoicomonas sp. 8E TaxID=3035692 RepID=UPI002938DBEF|nr:ankyrin repeat domain-containing protein [Endozoicomonas sp. 8E]WOG28592.1 ankyrin repeat domain-containing protein [Endozoicomonas sp. 8E]
MDTIANLPRPMNVDVTPEANKCSICHGEFRGSDVASVDANPECLTRCGHSSHLKCLTMLYVHKPIGSRNCGHCQGNPFPVLDTKTGKSYPDEFFPDQLFSRACWNGDVDQVKKSLAAGVYVNAVMSYDFNPLLIASAEGHTELAEVLINNGADVNAVMAEKGVTPLFFAAQNNHTDIVKLLINKGVNVDAPQTKDGATPLSIAVQKGCNDSVKLLLNAGADPNATLSNGVTPLYIAAFRGNSESMQLLLEKGADLDSRTKLGVTPLFAADARDNIECVKLLLNAGAKINVRASDAAPLTIATRMGCTTWGEALSAFDSLAEPADGL